MRDGAIENAQAGRNNGSCAKGCGFDSVRRASASVEESQQQHRFPARFSVMKMIVMTVVAPQT